MGPTTSPKKSRTLSLLTALFILSFFFLFSYHGLFSYFTFDDGTTVGALLRPLDTPYWQDLLHIVTVFTSAFRPLTTMFWRPLYALFGFNPLPFRMVVHILLTVNIGLAYVLARRLDATREAAALTALVFCYNASALDLYYNTCLVGDVMCFLLYVLAMVIYIQPRRTGEVPGVRSIVLMAVCFLLALDSKEQAVTLPGILVIYELLYRRGDFRDKGKAWRIGSLLAAMSVADGIYLKVKVADMSHNSLYNPHVSIEFILNNIGHYVEQLMYFAEKSVTALKASLILGMLLALGALLRRKEAIFGVVFFVVTLIPVAVIQPRGGYAAYIPYFGLALAAGSLVAGARSYVVGWMLREAWQIPTAIGVFLCTAVLLGWGHMVHRMPGTRYYEWSTPGVVTLMESFERTIPEFPPHTRVLLTDDPWDPDWGPMFLLRLQYHDNTIWVDRPKNLNHPPDPAVYDLVVSYRQPEVQLVSARLFDVPMNWEIRGKTARPGQFLVSSPNAHGAASRVDFTPSTVKSGQTVTVTIPGLSKVAVNALYRVVSGTSSTQHLVEEWCRLDERGTCTITAPYGVTHGEMKVDWIQPASQRWIFTHGELLIR